MNLSSSFNIKNSKDSIKMQHSPVNKISRWGIFVICVFIFLLKDVSAQTPKNFSHDPVKFLAEMELFLAATNKKDADKIIERFTVPWNANKFTPEQRERIYNTVDAMLKKRLKAFPDFSNYLNALIGFSESEQTSQSFDNWHAGIDKLLKGSVRNFSSYLDVCYDLFSTNTLYSSASTVWKSSGENYTFEFDSLPRIVFGKMDLTCRAKNDSSVIYGTQGVYYPNLKKFYGSGGTVYWVRAGLSKTDTYAELKKYVIDVTGSDFDADSVTFYNKQVFSQPLIGRLTEKLLVIQSPEDAGYPRFRSYNLNLEIKELIKDASYRGGFSMQGSKMIGSGGRERAATMTFNRNNKPFLVAAAQSFVMRPDRIVSDNVAVTFYMDKDSIYHPSVQFKYITKEKELTLIRPSGKSMGTPYYNSYHDVDMYFDAMTWKVDDPLIDLKMISGEGEVKLWFESANYFRAQRYQQLQGFAEVNPLYTIKQYGEKFQTREISVPEYASYVRMSESEIRGFFLSLNSLGFLAYDEATDRAVIKDRLYYYLSASVGKTDYDIIEFASQISGKPNATINLLNYDINMRGVARVSLSDTQNVYCVPSEQELTLKKNRDFTFNGRVHAGRFDFSGKEFAFNYEEFNIHLKAIDSLSLKIPGEEPLPDGRIPLLPIKSVLQNVTGYLQIDRVDNKSSYQKSPDFPKFKSDAPSFVYYDYPWIFNSIYDRSAFYFKVEPFTIDSLDNFKPEGLSFAGALTSAGIFPDIPENLTIQRDYSLGFKRVLGDEGLPAYASRGKYYEKLDLSNAGLRGAGKIDYLSASAISKDILFFPDSANADIDDFSMTRKIVAGVEYPSGKGSDVYMNWRPKEDRMFVFKKTNDFNLYDGKVAHNGDLVVAKTGLSGNGTSSFDQARVASRLINFKGISFVSDTSDFSLQSNDPNLPALTTTNMRSFIDLEKRFGEFSSNGVGSYVTFPLNQYISYIEKFRWLMDDKNVAFGMSVPKQGTAMNIAGSEFVSINPSQDSLRWFTPDASYSLTDYHIKANEVKEINVADASIIPGDGKVVIEKNAYMRTLNEARVVANTSTRFHTMTNATIDITSRKNYSGSGDYEYVDQLKVKHLLRMTQIGVDTSFQTYAHGEVTDSLNFMLSPSIQYKGRMSILASRQSPFFKGFARANHSCEAIPQNWFSFAAEIDPKGVNVPVKDPVNDSGEKLYSAIWFARDSTSSYGTFISPRRGTSDQEIISAEGLLSFDQSTREFKIVPAPEVPQKERDRDKTEKPFNHGNSFYMNDETCTFRGEGNINLGANFGQFKIKTIGVANLDPVADTLYFDGMMDMDFFFNNDALKIMAEMILSYPTLPPSNDNRTVFQGGMTNLLGKEEADKFISEISLYGTPKKVPEALQHSIFLSDVKFSWDSESLSYKSAGSIGVGYVGKVPVSRMVRGYVEIARKRSGDIFNFYIELDGNTYFFFNYQRGVMQAISSDIKFNDHINNMKPDKRVADEKDGKAPYQFLLSTERKKNEFVKRAEGRE